MKAEQLIQWMRHPSGLDSDSLPQLKALLEAYPCFGAARMLYLKNLDNLHDPRLSKALIMTSLSVPDRRGLYYFMEEKMLPENSFESTEKVFSQDGFSLIDRFLVKRGASQESASDQGFPLEEFSEGDFDIDELVSGASVQNHVYPDLQQGVQYAPFSASESESEPPSEIVQKPFDLLSTGEEAYAVDYLDFIGKKQEPGAQESGYSPMRGQDIIDAFLASGPSAGNAPVRLTRSDEGGTGRSQEGLTSSPEEENLSAVLPEDTFTETLAKIYLKQKRYDRALEIFKSLNLKYPEKSVYFADQIRFLEKLIDNIHK